MNAFVTMDINGVMHSVLILTNAIMVITAVVTIHFVQILMGPTNATVLTDTKQQQS